jgi:hypothetical protein
MYCRGVNAARAVGAASANVAPVTVRVDTIWDEVTFKSCPFLEFTGNATVRVAKVPAGFKTRWEVCPTVTVAAATGTSY